MSVSICLAVPLRNRLRDYRKNGTPAELGAFLSVSIVALDEPVRDGLTVLVGCCWAIGSSLQIASGAIARNYGRAEDRSE